ncbi:MAG: 2,3-bisphosphoglycerate-independent phosphoglycerate mutase [Nitrospirae bacterium]|nr:2,3-bisphosphoglycerate-independent phosphoglycerate mutase [Nitrospirota bacterium]
MIIPKPLCLIILDGWGINPKKESNAVAMAQTPVMDGLLSKYPHSTLDAAGEAVGLPNGQMGNSEVGHMNLGAGRTVYQDITKINKSISDGDFFHNPALMGAIGYVRAHGSSLHLMGLLSDGGVHSHIDHLIALLTLAKSAGLTKVYIHAFLDGRDVPPRSAEQYIKQAETKMEELGVGTIATVGGRYYAMDRDNRWERVGLAYDTLTLGLGKTSPSAIDAVKAAYERGENDEFVKPTVILNHNNPTATINDSDAVLFFNFRPDRARELTRALTRQDFTGFERKKLPDIHFVCTTQYDATFDLPVAYPPEHLSNTLSEYLSKMGKTQFHIAETEKYAHVTFFFNGFIEKPYKGEYRSMIPSPKVATYDLKPEMSAFELTDVLLEKINSNDYDVIIVNYANLDMVGHTGIFEAAVKAVETVDECLGKVLDAIISIGGAALVTADHGNVEQMIYYENNSPHTAHTTNPVPFILVSEMDNITVRKGIFADVAPTILEMLDLEVPPEMTGVSLIARKI